MYHNRNCVSDCWIQKLFSNWLISAYVVIHEAPNSACNLGCIAPGPATTMSIELLCVSKLLLRMAYFSNAPSGPQVDSLRSTTRNWPQAFLSTVASAYTRSVCSAPPPPPTSSSSSSVLSAPGLPLQSKLYKKMKVSQGRSQVATELMIYHMEVRLHGLLSLAPTLPGRSSRLLYRFTVHSVTIASPTFLLHA